MRIDRLNQGTILVAMEAQDMREYELDFERDTDISRVRGGLKRLLYRIGEECAFSPRGMSFLVEALPAGEGWLLMISVHPGRRRIYRVKGGRRLLCVFDSVDSLLDWKSKAKCARYTLFRWRGLYVLLPEGHVSPAEHRLLSEYGRMIAADKVAVARVREYGAIVGVSR